VQPEPEIEPRRGLALLLDILIAPRRAYATIAATQEWWPAGVAVFSCLIASAVLSAPAQLHVDSLAAHATLRLSSKTIALLATSTAIFFLWQVFSWNVVGSLFANFCAAGRPAYTLLYRTFFALAANATIPSALGALVQGIVIRAHDPTSYLSEGQLVNALPVSLAVFASAGNARELNFLSNFDVTTVWSVLLVAYGGRVIGGIKLVPALIVPCAIVLLWAFIGALPDVFQAR
jgi:hypothetical protein